MRKRAGVSSTSVAVAEAAIQPYQMPPQAHDPPSRLYVLSDVCLTGDMCFIPFTCRGLVELWYRFLARPVLIAMDVKMKCLYAQCGIMPVGILVKHRLARTTTTRRGGKEQRLQATMCRLCKQWYRPRPRSIGKSCFELRTSFFVPLLVAPS